MKIQKIRMYSTGFDELFMDEKFYEEYREDYKFDIRFPFFDGDLDPFLGIRFFIFDIDASPIIEAEEE